MVNNEIKKLVDRTFQDKISAILLKYSNLTETQYETLIINYIAENLVENKVLYTNRSLYRSKIVSRGSYSRTLQQAKKNIRSAIFTMLLLSYIGIFDNFSFDDYQILSDKLKEYTFLINNSVTLKDKSFIKHIEDELLEGINTLTSKKKIK